MTTEICTRTEIDPRGPRFGGTITTIVLAIALVTVGTPLSDVLVVWQAIVFGLGAIVGLHAQPYGILYRKVVGPRLAPPHPPQPQPLQVQVHHRRRIERQQLAEQQAADHGDAERLTQFRT